MSKAAGPSSAPAIERLSLGSSSSPSTSRPSHALPNLSTPANSTTSDGTHPGTSATLITPDVLDLATPTPHYVDAQALHTLATEMVFTLIHSSRFVSRKQSLAREELRLAGITLPPPSRPAAVTTTPNPASSSSAPTSSSSYSEVITSTSGPDAPTEGLTEIESALVSRLENIGHHVGYHLTETLARDRARFVDTLDVLKFICKEVWTAVWGKQVDNLRTNHRGVYVLHDNNFQPLKHVSTNQGASVTAKEARVFLAYPVGIVKGALAQLDVVSAVVAETNQVPGCVFHVKTSRSGGPAAAAASGVAAPATAS